MKTENMKNQKKSFVTYFVVLCALVLATFSTARAATFTVNVNSDLHDTNPGDGECYAAYRTCTLRAAIEEANALPGSDAITFSSFFKAPNPPKTIVLTFGALEIKSELGIHGVGARQLIIDGNHQSRVFRVSAYPADFTAAINYLTVQNGYAYELSISVGAGVVNTETLLMTGVTVRDNYAMTENDPTQGEKGGGIYNSGNFSLIQSTVSGNKAGTGGGIYNEGSLYVKDSTISGNSSYSDGGGIVQSFGQAWILNSTIVNNQSLVGWGGGIGNYYNEPVHLANTIVASNNAALNNDIDAKIISGGNNLVKTRGTSTGYVASDLPDGTDPKLGILKNNGGPTNTHALNKNSPAINAGSNCKYLGTQNCVGEFYYDQRGLGFPRKVGRAVDIGAFEFQGGPGLGVSGLAGKVLEPNGGGLNKAVVTLTGADGATERVEADQDGNFSFDNVTPGRSYVIAVESRQYNYTPQSVLVTEEREDVSFVPAEDGTPQ